jgi:hypothetical protein
MAETVPPVDTSAQLAAAIGRYSWTMVYADLTGAAAGSP